MGKFKAVFTAVATFCPSVGRACPAGQGGRGMMERNKPKIDARAGQASPLGVVISENDKATMSMVRQAIDALSHLPADQWCTRIVSTTEVEDASPKTQPEKASQ